MLLLLAACAGSAPDDSVKPGDDSEATTGPDTGPGEVFEVADPVLTAQFDAATWTTSTGYWFGSEDLSSIRGELAIDSLTVESFTLVTDGDIHHAGSFPVTSIEYVQAISQSGDAFHYYVLNPPGVRLIVEGWADGDQAFAHLEGTAEMVDNVGGGSRTLVAVTAVSWHIR